MAKDPSIELVMETGTLDGTGASRCLLAGLKEAGGNGRLITIEAMKDWYDAVSQLTTMIQATQVPFVLPSNIIIIHPFLPLRLD